MRFTQSIVMLGAMLLLKFAFPESARAQLGEHFLAATERKQSLEKEQEDVPGKEHEKSSVKGRIYIIGQAGFLFGNLYKEEDTHSVLSSSLQLSSGYQYRYWLQTGVGAGYAQYDRIALFPIYAEIRGNLKDRDFSPYYSVKAGKSLAGFNDNLSFQTAKGGFMAEGQAGIAIQLRNMSFLMGGGYHFQKVELEGTSVNWWGQEQYYFQKRNIRRMLFTSSLKFNF